MKEIYHFKIHISEDEVNKHISVYYEDKDKAIKELVKWKTLYKSRWNIPDAPNNVWTDIKDAPTYVRYIGRMEKKLIMFYGDVFDENFVLDKGEELFETSGCVFRYVSHPNIYGYNYTPWLVGDTKVSLRELIDMERKERVNERIVSEDGVERVSPEEEERYYNVRHEIIHNMIYKK